MHIKGWRKPIVFQQVYRVPLRDAGKSAHVLIGRNGIALAYQIAGESETVWLRTLDVRTRRSNKEQFLDLAASFGKELGD